MSIIEVMKELLILRENVASLRRELQFGRPQEVYHLPQPRGDEPCSASDIGGDIP